MPPARGGYMIRLRIGARAAEGCVLAVFAMSCSNGSGLDRSERIASQASRSVLIAQTPLDGATVPKYVDPLPTSTGHRVQGTALTVDMREFRQQILPASIYAALPAPFSAGTLLWGYSVNNTGPSWPAATIEAQRNVTTTVTYTNNLRGPQNAPPALQELMTMDQTIHWADPLGTTVSNGCMNGPPLAEPCLAPYVGPAPAVAHLHGAEVASAYDGHPDTWFTPALALKGPGYVTNKSIYPNGQEATALWFHDHALGMTRLNVYSGLAGFYLIRDSRDTGLKTNPIGLPAGALEQELLIADRQFDTHGHLLFPDGTPGDNPTGINGPPPNPDRHPTWIPEFFGDVMTVNGKSWPFFSVQPRRYRFRVLNSSNARFLQMQLFEEAGGQPTKKAGPAIWQIGSDGGLLNNPTNLDDHFNDSSTNLTDPANWSGPHLFLAPAERADVIIDFAGQAGKRFILSNLPTAFAPFPSGSPPDPNTTGQVMEFRVDQPLAGADTTWNPATAPPNSLRAQPIVNIKPTSAKSIDKRRQLVLVEVAGVGGPEEVLLNNSPWNGVREGTDTPIPGSIPNGNGLYASENARQGSTEVWEVANLTADAHPLHIHLIQFQVINRQAFDRDSYIASWSAQFPGGTFNGVTYPPGTFIPGFGPPLAYTKQNAAGALGGNPDFTAFLAAQKPKQPDPGEAGWKDTVQARPFEITRIALRWAPQDVAPGAVRAGMNTFPFDPTSGGPGYVWHCHILDHEDNEMMRPLLLAK
jgi:spore coat protein A, manganese oxidase